MNKVIKDGKVAVLISHGFGAGWYTWNLEYPELLFHPKLVEMIEQGKANQIDDIWIEDNLGIKNIYCGGASGLRIHWLPIGTAFTVEDYDGAERLMTLEDLTLVA